MTDQPIFVTKPSLPPLEELVPYLESIWDSKVLTNLGPFQRQLEDALCNYLGVPFISLFSNGTLALMTALKALNISGEVITTPYSFVATAHSLLWSGAQPIFADIDPVTANLDPSKIEALITPQTSAILPVHVYGHPCQLEDIDYIAKKHNLKVIYDAAHAFGVKYKGTSVLNWGNLSVLSFHATKVFNTFEGGAIICSDSDTKDQIDKMRNFGFTDEISITEVGLNGKMNEFCAALGLLQLQHIDYYLEKRKLIDAAYREGLKGAPGIRCHIEPDAGSGNYGYFPVFVEQQYILSRDMLYKKLADNGINSRRYFFPLITDYPMYKNGSSSLSVAKAVAEKVICLPIYDSLREEDVANIVDKIRLWGSY